MVVETKYEKNKNLIARSLVNSLFKYKDKPVFLCVGTDKVVGDSIGAIVGEILTNNDSISGYIYGNLEHNITATNISDTIFKIKNLHPNSPIVVIDGILGDIDEVGQVKFYPYGTIPAGEFNNGEFVGDYSILAVVDVKGIDTLTFLNSVKLKTAIDMARFIADSIARAYKFSQKLI